MKGLKKFRDGSVGPVIILLAICFVVTYAMSAVYNITAERVEQSKINMANEARFLVLPQADSFSAIEADFTQGITEAYRADNGEGFVFASASQGFNGYVTFIIGISPEGEVVGINMFDHNETPGLGTKVGDTNFLEAFLGNTDETKLDGVSGATLTSNALRNAVAQAKAAYGALS